MFDPRAVIASVQNNQIAADWRVFRGKSQLGCAIFVALFILFVGTFFSLIVGMGISMFLFPFHTVISPMESISNIGGIALVVLLIIEGLFLWFAVWFVLNSLAEGRSLLVLLPEGVVDCHHGKLDKITSLQYDRIQKMNMDKQTTVSHDSEGHSSSSTKFWLNVFDEGDGYVKWNIRSAYGDPVVTGGNIIAAFEHYQRQQMQRH